MREIRSVRPGLLALPLCFALAAGISFAADQPEEKPTRIVFLKADGLPPDLMAAVAFPERSDLLERLDYADDLRLAIREYQRETGKQIILPNIRKHFFEDGVFFENMNAATMTLSAVSWGVIETGQHSVVKGHGVFSRDTSYMRSHLDGFRDSIDQLKRQAPYGEMKTSATWNLDQFGVSLLSDAYDPRRVWLGTHIYRRTANRELLLESGRRWLKADGEGFGGIVRGHLSRQVTGIDYTVFNQEMSGWMLARKILEKDLQGNERFDYLSPLYTIMDHQQHIDPHPRNLVYWLVKLDELVGSTFDAVAQSRRRDRTIVVLTSDHGSEIQPGKVGFSFPLTRHFRTPIFGGHTVKTLMVESAWKALSTPIPGVDFPRVYESPNSPYGKAQNPKYGEDDYVTCFIDPYGNGRATVYLRNDDINRLHLILLELKKEQTPERFAKLRRLFRETLDQTRRWLEPDLALMEDYQAGSKDLISNLNAKRDKYAHDSAWRLEEELKDLSPVIETLRRLLSIRFDDQPGGRNFDQTFSRPFEISAFIPKEYQGRANSIRQLSRYTMGLDENLQWVSSTVDFKDRPVPLNYFDILSDYQAPNAPVNGRHNPFDLITTALPTDSALQALQEHGLAQPTDVLRQAVWIRSTAKGNPLKGGQAIVARTSDDRVAYVPVSGLKQAEDLSLTFQLSQETDPLGLLRSPRFLQSQPHASRLDWMRRWRPSRQWLEAAYLTEYGIAVNVILDLLNNEVPRFVDSADFQKYLVYFSSEELKQRYIRGLKRKHAATAPDFIVWAEELWNFNSKARTSGGNHASLRPIVSRSVFTLWGGNDTGLARGRTVTEVCSTLDIAPTLFRAAGMLDENNRMIPRPDAVPERIFLSFPGKVIDIWQSAPPPIVSAEPEG